MKRDMELVREILMRVEDLPYDGSFHDIQIEGRSDEAISYHVMLLDEAGLLEAEDLSSLSGTCWKPKQLTYSGHEFLDAARSNKVWEGAKVFALRTTGTLTLEGLKLAVSHVMKTLMGP